MDLDTHIGRGVDLSKLLNSLAFDADTVVPAAMNQALLHEAASRLRAQSHEERLNAKIRLEVIEAEAYIAAKRHLERSGDKTTVDMIRALMASQKKVVRAKQTLAKAEREDAYAQSLVESFRQRGHAIKVVADLTEGELKSIGRSLVRELSARVTEQDIKDKLRKRYPKSKF